MPKSLCFNVLRYTLIHSPRHLSYLRLQLTRNSRHLDGRMESAWVLCLHIVVYCCHDNEAPFFFYDDGYFLVFAFCTVLPLRFSSRIFQVREREIGLGPKGVLKPLIKAWRGIPHCQWRFISSWLCLQTEDHRNEI